MPREIKFRVWHKPEKKMYDYLKAKFGRKGMSISLQGKMKDVDGMPTHSTTPNEDVELMQFTGLKDKNSVEIYEGDIVSANFSPNFKAKILYDNDQTSFWLEYEQSGYERPCTQMLLKRLVDNNSLEVIGNIYENPELLTQSND